MWLDMSVAQVTLGRDRDVGRYKCGLGGSGPWRRQT